MRLYLVAFTAMIVGASPLLASDFDWRRWRDLPVQSGGRRKPLDTLTWETVRLISNQTKFADPETDEPLNATALYLSMLFDWQGWDHVGRDRLMMVNDWRPHYYQLHQPDKWDNAPLLRVDYLKLRAKLGLEADQKFVSPFALSTTLVEDPRSGTKIAFSTWGNHLVELEDKGTNLTELEKKGLELANRLWSYQSHRMGRGLEILPIKGSGTQEWVPIAHLFITRFDDASDPTGDYRQVQNLLRKARAAYQQNDGEMFNQIADELKSTLRVLGQEL